MGKYKYLPSELCGLQINASKKKLHIVSLLFTLLYPVLAFGYGPTDFTPNGAHPRLFMDATTITRLNSKVASNDTAWLALKAKADAMANCTVPAFSLGTEANGTIFYSYEGAGWLDAAQTLSLAYNVTGNTAYADKLIQLSDVMAAATYPAVNAISADSYYPSRNIPVAAALIFDCLSNYAPYTTTKKNALISTVNGWYDAWVANGYQHAGPAVSNYFGGGLFGFGLWGLATYGDNARSSEINTAQRALWDSKIVPSFADGVVPTYDGPAPYQGGYPVQGFNYGPTHFLRLLEYANAVLTATGEDIYPANTGNMARSLMYNLMPNRWQSTDEGTFPSAGRGVMQSTLSVALSSILPGTLGDQAAYFAKHLATPPVSSNAPNLFEQVLYENSRTQTDYRTVQPLYYRSQGDEHLYFRSDWSDNAVWSSFTGFGSTDADHQSKAAGHIALARGADYLLVYAGQWKGAAGYTGTPSTDDKSSSALNTLYFNDGGAYMYTGSNYKGGQGLWGVPDVLKSEQSSSYVYAKANLTSSYANGTGTSGLNYFHRNYVNIGGTTIVLFDRIKAKLASYEKELRFHLHNQSTTANLGGVIQSTLGSSRVFINSIYPTNGTVTLDTSDIVTTMPRVRILPPATITDWNPLTVITTGPNSASMPPTEQVSSTVGTMIGTYIKDPVNPNVVMFSNDPNNNDVTGNVTYTLSAPLTGKSPWHTIVHLPANTDYTVIRPINATVAQTYQLLMENSPAKGAVYKTSSQGVLRLAPDISIQTPADGATVAGKKKVTLNIPDNFVVTGMEILVDGTKVTPTPPFTAPNIVELNTLAPMTTGAHTIAVVATDADGATSQSNTININVVSDTTNPTVAITDPLAGDTVFLSKTVNMNVTDDFDVASVVFYVDTLLKGTIIGPAPFTISWDTTAYPDGNHTLTADAIDSSGNTGTSAPITVMVSNDAIIPVVTAFTLPATATSLTVDVSTLTATDNVAVTEYLLTETNTKPAKTAAGWSATKPATYLFASSGNKTLYAWAKDAMGNVSDSTALTVATVAIETELPVVSDFTLPTNAKLNVPITLFNATDNIAVTGYLINETATAPLSTVNGWSVSAPTTYTFADGTSEGSKTLYAWAKDAAGNVSVGKNATVIIDTTPPTLDLTPPTPTILSSQTLTGTVFDNNLGTTVTVKVGDAAAAPATLSGSNWSYPAVNFGIGAKTIPITVTAQDAAGNVTVATGNIIKLLAGDIDGNGTVDVGDALLAMKSGVGKVAFTGDAKVRGDVGPVNGGVPVPNGSVDTGDAVVILGIAVGLYSF